MVKADLSGWGPRIRVDGWLGAWYTVSHPRQVTSDREAARSEGPVQGRPLSRHWSLHSQHCSTLETRLFPWQP